MKLHKHHLGALTVLVALTLAACGGGAPTGYAVPSGTPPAAPAGALALISSPQAVALSSANGASGVVTIPAGTGSVNVAVSASPPAGTVALQSAVRKVVTASLKPLSTGPDTTLVYVAVTASATATLNGVPGFTLTFASPPAGSVFEALWNGAQWITVGNAGTVSGSTVTLAGSTATQTVTPGAPLYLVAYEGVTQPGVQSNVIVDGGFETEGAAKAFAGATDGWAACSYAHANAESTSPPATPNPAVSPAKITAQLVSANSPAFTVGATPKPTATPVVTPAPTVTPAIDAGSFAALTYTGTGADTSYGKSVAGANGICQTFVVPASGVLSLAVQEGGDESSGFGDQEAVLFNGGLSALAVAAPSPIPVFSELNATVPAPTTSPGAYVNKGPYALTLAPPMGLGIPIGTTVTLYVGTYDDGPSNTFGEYMFVDNVAVMGYLPQ
jgi:hypothetical protein